MFKTISKKLGKYNMSVNNLLVSTGQLLFCVYFSYTLRKEK